MHTKPAHETGARSLSPKRSNPTPQPNSRRRPKLKKCPGCGQRKASTAFRALKPGEPYRVKIRCRQCESHGGARLRREHQREEIRRTRPAHKFCRRCEALKPLAEFARDRRSADGCGGICAACQQRTQRMAQKPAGQPGGCGKWTRRRTIGLAIAHASCPPGHRRTAAEIAAYCGCDEQVIRRIEEKALQKVLGPLRRILRKATMHVREVRL